MVEASAQKRQQRKGEILGADGPATKEVEVKNEDQVIDLADVTGPTASPKLGQQLAEVVRKVREAMNPV